MNNVDILIVEDEFIVAHDLEIQLKKLGYNIPGNVGTGEDAVELVRKKQPDILLMDINLGEGINGIEAAHQIQEFADIPLIFITAYSDQKTFSEAKTIRPHAYIVKPFHFHNLVSAIEIALYNFSSGVNADIEKKAVEINDNSNSYLVDKTIFLKKGDGFIKVDTDEIRYLEAQGSYCIISTGNDEHMISRNLHCMMEKISNPNIIRTHRSYAVNIQHIDRILSSSIKVEGKEIPVSRSYLQEVKARTVKKDSFGQWSDR